MKIGMLIYSKTGNTRSVAEKLSDALIKAGHSVNIEPVAAENDDEMDLSKVRLSSAPDLRPYDALILGSPVHGFSLASVMQAYLSQCPALGEKKVACYVTQTFPYPFLGGNRSIGQMTSLCKSKGAQPLKTGIINWSSKKRETQIGDLVESFGGLF